MISNLPQEEHPVCSWAIPSHIRDISFLNLIIHILLVSRGVKFYENIFPYKVFTTHIEMKQGVVIDIKGSVECEHEPATDEPQNEPETEPISPEHIQNSPTTFTQPPLRQSTRTPKAPSWHQGYVTNTYVTSNTPSLIEKP